MQKIREGQITVYLSLMLIIVLSLIGTLVESARLQGAIVQAQSVSDLALYSLFGEYNREMLEQYDLFVIDGGYGKSKFDKDKMNSILKQYMEYNVNQTVDFKFFQNADLWRIQPVGVSGNQYVLASDGNGEVIYQAALDYMKDTYGIHFAESVLPQLSDADQIKQLEANYEDGNTKSASDMCNLQTEKDAYRERYQEAVKQAEENGTAVTMAPPNEQENPVDSINGSKPSLLLLYVYPHPEQLSAKSISLKGLPSHRKLPQNGWDSQKNSNGVLDPVLFGEYLLKKMPNALEQAEDKLPLEYQLEYILCGKKSDVENLEGVANRLLLFRESMNFAYLLTDGEKEAEALALATALIGYLANPLLVEALKYALLIAWSFAESVIEVKELFAGKKVPFLPNYNTWKLSLSQITTYKDYVPSETKEENGLDYKGYLRLLLTIESKEKKKMRCMDMMESVIKMKSGNQNFSIDNCFCAMNMQASYHIESMFLNFPVKNAYLEKQSEGYDYNVLLDYAY